MNSQHQLCVHAHFYQPPREDPRTGEIPIEKGAAPFANWNEKIHKECYLPNAEMGNFSLISFNMGPTLNAWLAKYHPQTLEMIVSSDRIAFERDGVGNAMAQPYHHTILPLAAYQDKVTQVRWGIAEFEFRFGRKPLGMWLPETAVDTETLSVLAEHGIEYTILAPWQAKSKTVDVSHPYRVNLPDGKSIAVFFYHAGLSGGISFNPDLTTNADRFVSQNVIPAYPKDKKHLNMPMLLTLASDGELYGHHQPLRDYFLKRLLTVSCEMNHVERTTPAKWLKENPPSEVIHLREKTSWSCHHGVKRWSVGCECTVGDSSWKKNLRQAMDRIAAALDRLYFENVQDDFSDPWEARHQYIRVILGKTTVNDFINEIAGKNLSLERRTQIYQLLESQRERQKMFASCGWFFEDFDRIEPRNAVAYAAHAVRLARLATGVDLSNKAVRWLADVISPISGLKGDEVFIRYYS